MDKLSEKNFNSKILQYDHFIRPVKGIYIFKSDSGVSLYSKRNVDVQEDLFSAFLTALKGFFGTLSLGGLLSFSSENLTFYLATENNCLTAIVVDRNYKSDMYYNLAYEISIQFYKRFKKFIDSQFSFHIPNKDQFSKVVENVMAEFIQFQDHSQQPPLRLFNVNDNGELDPFEYNNERQLYEEDLFIAVNLITKRIFIVENTFKNVSSRKIFLATRSANEINQKEYKSEFHTVNVTDEWDFERIIEMIDKLVKRESYLL